MTGVSPFSGTVKFHLCGPSLGLDATATCDTGGMLIVG